MFLTGLPTAILTEHYNDESFEITYEHDELFWQRCIDTLTADMERDKFMTPEEAVAYGLADRIVKSRNEDNSEQ